MTSYFRLWFPTCANSQLRVLVVGRNGVDSARNDDSLFADEPG